MTNDEARMTKEARNPNDEAGERPGVSGPCGHNSSIVLRHSFVIRASSFVILLLAAVARAEDKRTTTVGMPARIDQLVLPGPELEAKPVEGKAPIVLRVVATYPHGTAFRYDLVYYGLDP